jgi:hypothetical protein
MSASSAGNSALGSLFLLVMKWLNDSQSRANLFRRAGLQVVACDLPNVLKHRLSPFLISAGPQRDELNVQIIRNWTVRGSFMLGAPHT